MIRRIAIIAGLVAVVLLVGWYEGIYKSENARISTLNVKAQAAAQQVAVLEAQYTRLVASEKMVPAERAVLAKLTRMVPNDPELDSLEKVIFNLAAQSGVQLKTIQSPQPANFGVGDVVGEPAPASGPAQISLTLGVAGSAVQIEHLYKSLDANARLFVIDNCTLSFGPASAPGTSSNGGSNTDASGVQIDIRTFYASPNANTAAS